jgi:beta-lactamase class A
LSYRSKAMLLGWLMASKPWSASMPAGLREGWRIGDKARTWLAEPEHIPPERVAAADAAVLLPPGGGAPILVAAYVSGFQESQAENDRQPCEARYGSKWIWQALLLGP